jgi:hypothetical protein
VDEMFLILRFTIDDDAVLFLQPILNSDCSDSDSSNSNSTQHNHPFSSIKYQELLILPFYITSCERVYVNEDEEAIIQSAPLWTMMKMTDKECRMKEVRRYECRNKMANIIENFLPFFVLVPPHPQSFLEMILSALRTLLPMLIEFLLLWKLMNGSSFLQSKNAMQQELEQPLDLSMVTPSQIDYYVQLPKALYHVRRLVADDEEFEVLLQCEEAIDNSDDSEDFVVEDRVAPVIQRMADGKRRRLNEKMFEEQEEFDFVVEDRVAPVIQRMADGKRRRLNEKMFEEQEEFEALLQCEEAIDNSDDSEDFVVENIVQEVVAEEEEAFDGGILESSSADASSGSVEETADQEIPAQTYGSGFWIDDQGRPRRFSCRCRFG